MSGYSDKELVALARQGDRAAIGELFSRYWRAARAAAFGVTGEFASAEDAAADAFAQALVGIHSLRDPDRFGAWLRTIVVRKARVALRAREAALDDRADERADRTEGADDELQRRELGTVIQHAVRELPEPLREAVALFYFEGYDTDSAARFLDIPPGTLRRRLHDGRTRLRTIVERLLQGAPMNDERARQTERLETLIDDDKVFQALRETLALRPPPGELVDLLVARGRARKDASGDNAADEFAGSIRGVAQRVLRPSDRASDPRDPVGSTAIAIRRALPRFQEWRLDPGDAAERFLTFSGEHRDRLLAVLPPGFAEGHPGAFVRATRACLVRNENGSVRSIYEQLLGSADEHAFRGALREASISDVLDLTWMAAGQLELRSVQGLLEDLTAAVIPGIAVRFSSYDEPRYRSALQLHIGNVGARAACGGVLGEWPGRPAGIGAAHLRILLEPWATVRSGETVEFDRVSKSVGRDADRADRNG